MEKTQLIFIEGSMIEEVFVMSHFLKVGSCLVDSNGNIIKLEREWYRQGFIFKDVEAFLTDSDKPCYVAEDDYPDEAHAYTRREIEKICHGDKALARMIFWLLDWQHPETIYDEYLKEAAV